MATLAALSIGFTPVANAGGLPLLPRHPVEQHAGLDLRLPAHLPMADSTEKSGNAFPSAARREILGDKQEFSLPALGNAGRTPSRLEELARKVHREGLPVARLWENKSALLSLGLSPKGKPGLWLTQKVP